ncbi:GNAT family N-acetyltransferase [Roseomonas arctica]|uniref:GNAT family N-acetyltransferase n=2 Tax=Plastoroseomonas arctica TaxID=1509237 RepID=A0AAF1JTU3_9PROT|nr:GNAT family N-acetyltransferase [Plastoroseomonas arctica]MBR0653485.1 GNAT family N-acetyltransferase [Plastoroseomonas arctica]
MEASAPTDVAAVAALFEAYAASLPAGIGVQDFSAERATLPGQYAPPGGALILARAAEGTPLGCVGLRSIGDARGEIKRLYVAPEARGLGLGRALLEAATRAAVGLGHGAIWLDSLPSMTAAQALYRAAGFRPIPRYNDSQVPGTVFFGKDLP